MSVDSRIKNLVDSSGEEHTLNFCPHTNLSSKTYVLSIVNRRSLLLSKPTSQNAIMQLHAIRKTGNRRSLRLSYFGLVLNSHLMSNIMRLQYLCFDLFKGNSAKFWTLDKTAGNVNWNWNSFFVIIVVLSWGRGRVRPLISSFWASVDSTFGF